MTYRNPEWQLHPETGRVSITDLMGAALVDVSDTQTDRADGVTGAPRSLKATEPWAASLVRRGERDRVRKATSYMPEGGWYVDTWKSGKRAGQTRLVKVAGGADARIAKLLASYGVDGPTPRPDMFDAPYAPPTIDVPLTEATIVALRDLYVSETLGSEAAPSFEQAPPPTYDCWTDALLPKAATVPMFEAEQLPDTYVRVGRDADLEAAANDILRKGGWSFDGTDGANA